LSLEYTYDQFGAVTEIEVDQCGAGCNGTMEYEYDEAGRLTSQPGVDESLGKLEYDYEGAGLVAEFSYPVNWDYGSPGPTPSPTRFHREYVYDMADRTLDVNDGSVSGTPTPIVSYSYNKSSQLTQAEREDGSESAWDYDSTTGQLTKITHKNPQQTTISSFEYTYDDDGLRTSCTREDGDVITYGYDDQNRLVDEWRKDGETTVYRRQYEYDRVGNRTKLTKNDGGGSTVSVYQYNGLGRLASVAWPSPTPTDRYVYSYDANGNLEEKEEQTGRPGSWATEYTWTYSWDTQDRLTKVEKYDEVGEEYDVCVEYKYCPSCGGALSERIEYESDRSTVKSWLRYQYHGLNLLRIDEKYDTNGENGIQSSDLWRVLNWYVHGPGSIGQTVRATWYSYRYDDTNVPCDSGEYYYMYDALGNVNGVLQDGTYYRWETDAFGNDLPMGNDFLPVTSEGPKEHLTGNMYDTTTKLYYFHARWYSPEAGRFVSMDPLMGVGNGHHTTGEQALKIPLNNAYGMASESPLTHVDPSGMESVEQASYWAFDDVLNPLAWVCVETCGFVPFVKGRVQEALTSAIANLLSKYCASVNIPMEDVLHRLTPVPLSIRKHHICVIPTLLYTDPSPGMGLIERIECSVRNPGGPSLWPMAHTILYFPHAWKPGGCPSVFLLWAIDKNGIALYRFDRRGKTRIEIGIRIPIF
jgi:RHS repeat-associated protein